MPLQYDTLGILRARLRTRLGFSAAGAAAGVQQEILNGFLQTAQVTLYWLAEWNRLRRYEDKAVGVDQYLIDYPTTAHPDRVKAISIYNGTRWSEPIKRGIPATLYTTQANKAEPYRWEPYEQIELFPKADKSYTARVFFVKLLERFEQENDRASIDSDLIFQHALGDAKEHYRQPDWKRYAEARDALIIKLKGKNWGQTIFSPYDYIDEQPRPKPVVV